MAQTKVQGYEVKGGVAMDVRPVVEAAPTQFVNLEGVARQEKKLLQVMWALLVISFVAIAFLEMWRFATSFLLFVGMAVVLFLLFKKWRLA